jgi:putative tricarboxylic transport membrane protein
MGEAVRDVASRMLTRRAAALLPDQSTRSEADEQGAWARPVAARVAEAIVALALLASGLFFVWQAALLPFGRVGLPGPGFFPFALAIALGLLAMAILYRIWLSGTGAGDAVFLGHRDVLLTLLALAGTAVAFERVGAYVALGSFAAFLLLLVARSALWRVLMGATLGMVAVWLFFGLALGVRLPTGDLWPQLLEPTAGLPSDQPSDTQSNQQ